MLWLALVLTASPDGGACAARSDCALDTATKTCRLAASRSEAEGGPITESGATCVCEEHECRPFIVEPVACKSYRDCSLEREPFLHPVSAKQRPRPHTRPVRPCKDAERDSVCDEKTKTCRLVAWKC